MAITKMMHIKGKNGSNGLKRCIAYIMNPEKTEEGILVGSNVGTSPEEIFQAMMDTKEEWGKTDKRQGYHFVISWKPGEVTKEIAYEIAGAFCRQYLVDAYDYVYSVHTDQDHCHAHVVFNSVNRINGYKYRYEKGDWEKSIQPITDAICKKHGLQVLKSDSKERKSKTYAEHNAVREGLPTLTKIVCADIDQMILKSDSFESFIINMKKLGYRIRVGKYVTYYPPGFSKGRRDKTLGKGYSRGEILFRIHHKDQENMKIAVLDEKLQKQYDHRLHFYMRQRLSPIQFFYVRKVYYAGHYLEARNPFAVKWRTVRKDAMEIECLYKECTYLIDHEIKDMKELQDRYQSSSRKEQNIIRRILDRNQEEDFKEIPWQKSLEENLFNLFKKEQDQKSQPREEEKWTESLTSEKRF